MYILVTEINSMIALRFGRIVKIDLSGSLLQKGPRVFPYLISISNLFLRLSRRVVYSVKRLEDKKYILSCGSGLYLMDTASLTLKKILTPKDFKKCLNIGIVSIHGTQYILYSHYEANLDLNSVNIYAAPYSDLDNYQLIYSFGNGMINHIHSYYQFQDKILLNIGDNCELVGIWELDMISKEIQPILSGSQEYRAVFCFSIKDNFFIATDSPSGTNYIKKLQKTNNQYSLENIHRLEGPVIYGFETDNCVIFSTCAEPSMPLKWRAWLPLLDLKSNAVLYKFCKQSKQLSILSVGKKDFFSPYLFGFGSFQFPEFFGANPEERLVVNKVALLSPVSSSLACSKFSSYDIYEL